MSIHSKDEKYDDHQLKYQGIGLTFISNAGKTSEGTKPKTIIRARKKTGRSAPKGFVRTKPETTLMIIWPNSTAESNHNTGYSVIASTDLPIQTSTIKIKPKVA